MKYIFNFACAKVYQQHVALISTSEPRVKANIYFKFLKVFSYELTFVYLIATRMLKVLEKYFAIWREGHNGWKNMAQWKIMSPITASVSLSLAQLAIILSTLKISPTISIPTISLLPSSTPLFLFLPFYNFSYHRSTDMRRRERKGSSLIELFLFPCTLSRSPFIFKSPLLCHPIALRLNGSFCFCFFRFIYAGLLKNFTLTFMLRRNLRRGGWNFLRKLCGAYWSHFYRIFHGYLVISIINVPINLPFLII